MDGKHFVAKTAGFRSGRAAVNAELSTKNRKKKKPNSLTQMMKLI